MEKIKLFCLPYAGGSAMNYMSWKKHLDSRIELKPVELAGRGKRFSDPLYKSSEDAVNDIYNKICSEMDGTPYAIFGHSMGTLLTYELMRKINGPEHPKPIHVFFSGRFPPYVDGTKMIIHFLSDREFIDKISELGGMSEEVLNNNELINMFLPVLKSDYRLVETYKHQGCVLKLNCDISVLSGKYDHYVDKNDLLEWQQCTNKSCKFYEFDDGHFFINKYREEVIDVINKSLFINHI